FLHSLTPPIHFPPPPSPPLFPYTTLFRSVQHCRARGTRGQGYLVPLELVLLLDDTDLARQLLACTTQSLYCSSLIRVGHLEENATWLNVSHPLLNWTLTGTHTNTKWLLGQWAVWVDGDPYLATTLDVAVDGNTCCLNLTVGDVSRLQSLDCVVTESDGLPPLDRPLRVGRCWRRYFTRLGISMN